MKNIKLIKKCFPKHLYILTNYKSFFNVSIYKKKSFHILEKNITKIFTILFCSTNFPNTFKNYTHILEVFVF